MDTITEFLRNLFQSKTYDIWYAKQRTAQYNGSTLHCTDYHRIRTTVQPWQDAVESVRPKLKDVTILGVTKTESRLDGIFNAHDNGIWSWNESTPSLKDAMRKTYSFEY